MFDVPPEEKPPVNVCGVLSLLFAGLCAILLLVPLLWQLSPLLAIAGLVLGTIGCCRPPRYNAIMGVILSGLGLLVSALYYFHVYREILLWFRRS
jgi:hypothetical protein